MVNYRDWQLASKLGLIISVMLAFIFTFMIATTVLLMQSAMGDSVSAELSAVAKSNGIQVQQVFDTAGTVAHDMESYLVKAYKQSAASAAVPQLPPALPGAEAVAENAPPSFNSSIYGVEITQLSYNVENFITELARSTANNNADIQGVGAMFEPHSFDTNISDYAFYAQAGIGDNPLTPFAAYDSYSKETYYKSAAQNKQTVVTEPYEFNGVRMVTYAAPILYNGALQGVVMADINVTNFSKIDSTDERYPSMYSTIYDNDYLIVYDSEDNGNIGVLMDNFFIDSGELAEVKALMTNGQPFTIQTHREDGSAVTRFYYPVNAGGETWWSLTALDTIDMNAAVMKTSLLLVALSILALTLIVVFVVAALKKMISPIRGVVHAAEEIANGRFDIQLTARSGDEIGILTKTFDNTARMLQKIVQDIARVLNSVASKNLDVDVSADYVGELGEIKNSMQHIIGNLNHVMGGIGESADQVSSGSGQVAGGAQALSQGATEQASSIQELSATITEISQQVKRNAENAVEASVTAQSVGDEMEQSNQKMREMMAAMDEISGRSQEIGKIIKAIEDIAFQTNILALNAAVEAARAGAAGKGFAVVADEVRNLASKSAEASKNTAALIESSIKAVENGTKIADATAKSLLAAAGRTKDVVLAISEISEASREQSESIAQVTMGVDQISAVVQTNSATAEESAAASEELSGQAQMLKDMVGEFHLRAIQHTSLMEFSESFDPAKPENSASKY